MGFRVWGSGFRVHVRNNWLVRVLAIVILVQVLGKYLIIEYLDSVKPKRQSNQQPGLSFFFFHCVFIIVLFYQWPSFFFVSLFLIMSFFLGFPPCTH